jgi:hypothetical protein
LNAPCIGSAMPNHVGATIHNYYTERIMGVFVGVFTHILKKITVQEAKSPVRISYIYIYTREISAFSRNSICMYVYVYIYLYMTLVGYVLNMKNRVHLHISIHISQTRYYSP